MVSPVGRETPCDETSTPRNNVSAADHHGNLAAELAGRNQIAGNPVDGGLVDAEGLGAGEIFARELDHHATIDRLSHDAIAFPRLVRKSGYRLSEKIMLNQKPGARS